MPKVSVIIPSFNSAHVVPHTIESALKQTYKDFEVIVVDDGSTDNTKEVLARYGDRIRVVSQENKRHSGARNSGIRVATGEYIAFVDSDDIWLPDKLLRQVAVLDEHPEVVLVCCHSTYIDLEGNPIVSRGNTGDMRAENQLRMGNWTRELFLGDAVPGGGSSAVVRHDALLRAGMFDETIDYGEDWDTWMRLSFEGDFAYLPEALVRFRVSGWERVLRREASNELINRPMRILEKAHALWKGDPVEVEELHQKGIAMLWRRAALASYQLGFEEQGSEQFQKMLAAYPAWNNKASLLAFAIDRAKLIHQEKNDIGTALDYIRTYVRGLPESLRQDFDYYSEAAAWLYLGLARDEILQDNLTGAKRYWTKAVRTRASVLKNRGVLSLGVQLWAGGSWQNRLRSLTRWVRGGRDG